MKRTTAMFFSGLIGATAAHAQSSVTLYGVVDDGIAYTSNVGGKSLVAMRAGNLTQSFWGFQGAEDLGGGLKAIFKLENGFDLNTGNLGGPSQIFGRQAYVGFDSAKFGRITMGRQFDLDRESTGSLTTASRLTGGLGAHAGDVDNLWAIYNSANAVKYVSPNFGGVTLGAMYKLGNVAGDFTNSQSYMFSGSYSNGALTAAASFVRVNDPGQAIYGATTSPTLNGAWANPLTNTVFGGFASARRLQIATAGALYALGGFSAAFVYSNTRFEDVIRTSSTPLSGTFIFNGYDANVLYTMSGTFFVGAGFDYESDHDAHYSQVSASVKYLFSKSTLVYLTSAYLHASGTNSFGRPAVALTSSSSNQTTVILGMRHYF
ncbi:porin [Paraburkholderia sp. EG286B]|uniref:porin n=1 Tax=Paraburkholderia sp. EG286B TaxID=3237011 RepID=UPI0034D2D1A6